MPATACASRIAGARTIWGRKAGPRNVRGRKARWGCRALGGPLPILLSPVLSPSLSWGAAPPETVPAAAATLDIVWAGLAGILVLVCVILALLVNILARRQATAELRRSEVRLRTVFRAALNVAFVVVSPEVPLPLIRDFSPGARRLFGHRDADVLGRPVAVLHRVEDLPELEEARRRMDRGLTGFGGETEMVHASGRRLAVNLSTYPLYDETGDIYAYLWVAVDVTEAKRTAEDLVRARDAAEAAGRAKNEFLANMSHEIRTPLNAVLSMLQILSESPLDLDQRHCVDTAREAGTGLLALLNDVLDVARLEAGLVAARHEPVDIGGLLASVQGFFQEPCRAKGLALGQERDPGLPPVVLGDEARLRQVLFNLVGNAVKFTDHGSVSVEAWSLPHHHDPDRLRLFLTVRDTGIGIPDDLVDNLFRPFRQADGSLSRRYQGAGLGLTLVRRLAEVMGGGVVLESEEGRGTAVTVRVVVGRVDEALLPDGERPVASLRILVAEDDQASRLMIERLLRSLGHQPTVVEDGGRAMEALQAACYDCLLLDLRMPVLDGLQVARAVRRAEEIEGRPRLPLVALTAAAEDLDRTVLLEAGLDDWLPKPLNLAALNRVLSRLAAPEPWPA